MFGSSSLGGGLGGGGFGEPPQKKLKLDLPGSPVADKDDEMGPLAEGSSTTVQGSGSSLCAVQLQLHDRAGQPQPQRAHRAGQQGDRAEGRLLPVLLSSVQVSQG